MSPAPLADRPFFSDQTTPGDVLVAHREEEVVGYVKLQQTIALPSHAHVLEISGLAVSPGLQRQGRGLQLLQAAAQEAASRGAQKLTLRVLGPNTRARALYEAAGFGVEGILRAEFHIAGKFVDDILMARTLTLET